MESHLVSGMGLHGFMFSDSPFAKKIRIKDVNFTAVLNLRVVPFSSGPTNPDPPMNPRPNRVGNPIRSGLHLSTRNWKCRQTRKWCGHRLPMNQNVKICSLFLNSSNCVLVNRPKPKAARCCSICKQPGHTAKTCSSRNL